MKLFKNFMGHSAIIIALFSAIFIPNASMTFTVGMAVIGFCYLLIDEIVAGAGSYTFALLQNFDFKRKDDSIDDDLEDISE